MTINKIQPTNRNEKPGQGLDKNLFVKAGDFNPLVDAWNTFIASGGIIGGFQVGSAGNGITAYPSISYTVPLIASAAQQAILYGDTNRVVNTTAYLTTVTADTGAVVGTLAAGSVLGQLKKIYMTATGAGGSVVVTIAAGAFVGYNTWTFDAIGDTATFMWTASGWYPVEIIGAAGSTV